MRHYSRIYHGYDLGSTSTKEYRDIADSLGKFEGEPAYVPYCWDRLMGWGEYPDQNKSEEYWKSLGYTRDDYEYYHYDMRLPEIYCYAVNPIDLLMFPELAEVDRLYLYEDNYGFVNVYETVYRSTPLDFPFMGI